MVSLPVNGTQYPHRVQNLMLREYCDRHHLSYQMSGVELSVPGAHEVLKDIIAQKDQYEGILFFSLFSLPRSPELRQRIYELVQEHHKTLHFCLEQVTILKSQDISRIEDVLGIQSCLTKAPLKGKYWGTVKPQEIEQLLDSLK